MITTEVQQSILHDVILQYKLGLVFNKSYPTIRLWALNNNELLTTPKAQIIINEHLENDYKEFLDLLIPILENWRKKKLEIIETDTK